MARNFLAIMMRSAFGGLCNCLLYSSTNAAGGGIGPNGPLTKTKLAVFKCPSDNGADFQSWSDPYYGIDATNGSGYQTSYDFCVGYAEYYHTHWWQAAGKNSRPIFGGDANSGIRDVRDGTSNTAAMAECHRSPASGQGNMWAARQHVGMGVDFSNSWYGVNTTLRTVDPVNYPTYTIENGTYPWMVAGSLHSGGLNLLMGDGAVKFLSENTSRTIQHNLFLCADGGVVGEF
jgi:prepilin-type processing-associated H-X9-DG protein